MTARRIDVLLIVHRDGAVTGDPGDPDSLAVAGPALPRPGCDCSACDASRLDASVERGRCRIAARDGVLVQRVRQRRRAVDLHRVRVWVGR